MADMYGAVRSNEFRVKNVEAFWAWLFTYNFGLGVEEWTDKLNDDGSGTVSFGCEMPYPTAHPQVKVYEDDGGPTEEEDDYDLVECDLHKFATELKEHLADGEVFQVVASGNEKMRYVAYSELLVAQDIRNPVWICVYTDDDQKKLRERVLTHGSI